jgi:AraC family transcriptional regulator
MSLRSTDIIIDYGTSGAVIFPRPPLTSSYQAGWKNIQLAHYTQPAWETPEFSANQHVIILANWQRGTEVDLVVNGTSKRIFCNEDRSGLVEIVPARTMVKLSWSQEAEFTHLYLEPSFLTQVAYESFGFAVQNGINTDRVEISLKTDLASPLLWSIGEALRSMLLVADQHSCFYAESMATAVAAHLLTHYVTWEQITKEDSGLPKAKLKQAIDFINAHLDRNISLLDIAEMLGMSQYHFSRLFKQSTKLTPHAYLVGQRVNRAKQLLVDRDMTMLDIAEECGFANPSHFSRCFRQYTGMSPMAFRQMSEAR